MTSALGRESSRGDSRERLAPRPLFSKISKINNNLTSHHLLSAYDAWKCSVDTPSTKLRDFPVIKRKSIIQQYYSYVDMCRLPAATARMCGSDCSLPTTDETGCQLVQFNHKIMATKQMRAMHGRFHSTPSPEDITEALRKLRSEWPDQRRDLDAALGQSTRTEQYINGAGKGHPLSQAGNGFPVGGNERNGRTGPNPHQARYRPKKGQRNHNVGAPKFGNGYGNRFVYPDGKDIWASVTPTQWFLFVFSAATVLISLAILFS